MNNWYVYIVRCRDRTLYTGITTDVTRRVAEHNAGVVGKGAKYTAARGPVALVYCEVAADKSAATKREYVVRTLSRRDKEKLFNSD